MKLYKTDSKGKIRVWWADTYQDELNVYHGIDGGKIITETTKCAPTNLGRANARTAAEQAEAECKALYTKKIERDGYTDSPNTQTHLIQPMLARDYTTVGHQVDWKKKTWTSAKYDGVRAIWIPTRGLQSRKGTFYKIEHLEEILSRSTLMLDGEIYLHGEPLNRIVSAAKKPKAMTEQLEFHVFDHIGLKYYEDRYIEIEREVRRLNSPYIKLVKQTLVENEIEMKIAHKQHLAAGYEGVMIRQNDIYKQGERPDSLYKYKTFQEGEFEITGIKPDRKGQAVFICGDFDVRMKGTNEERKEILQNPNDYIGKMLTVRYFDLTEFGKPQFPVGITVREDL